MDLNNKTILITGGTGSFGRKFTEYALKNFSLKKLIIFSRDELKQSDMRSKYGGAPLRYFIGDVRDRDRLQRAMSGVDFVVHAAAMKQVPACEYNPSEAIKTNVIGAQNVIDAAISQRVAKVISISTDKAVNPINLYGATKLCAEKLFVNANAYSGAGNTSFGCARYGNVVGSRGSVVPLFLSQKNTGKVTVTDDRMTRFWITLQQGVQFVIRCLGEMQGGEVFVPKIPSMKIIDLARTIAPECEMEIIGIRSGEKIHELLISKDEARLAVDVGDMYVMLPSNPQFKGPDWSHGAEVSEGFEYTSENNSRWLTEDEILEIVKG